MKTMYFQMATLLLANRTAILRFSDEVSAIMTPSSSRQSKEEARYIVEYAQKLKNIYDVYSHYDGRLYFKEVTHQDQGIELYQQGIKQMSIVEHHDKLDHKFTRLFEYSSLLSDSVRIKEEQKNTDAMNRLTLLGAVFLPASFILSFLSLDIFEYNNTPSSLDGWIFLIVMLAFILPLGILSWKSESIRKIISKDKLKLIGLGIIIIAAIGVSYYLLENYKNSLNATFDQPSKASSTVKSKSSMKKQSDLSLKKRNRDTVIIVQPNKKEDTNVTTK
jgi:hypothetical protein